MNTRSPETIGDDQPRPGTSIFHATFSFVLQCSGRFGLLATPRASGPRNCGQSPLGAAAWGMRQDHRNAKNPTPANKSRSVVAAAGANDQSRTSGTGQQLALPPDFALEPGTRVAPEPLGAARRHVQS